MVRGAVGSHLRRSVRHVIVYMGMNVHTQQAAQHERRQEPDDRHFSDWSAQPIVDTDTQRVQTHDASLPQWKPVLNNRRWQPRSIEALATACHCGNRISA